MSQRVKACRLPMGGREWQQMQMCGVVVACDYDGGTHPHLHGPVHLDQAYWQEFWPRPSSKANCCSASSPAGSSGSRTCAVRSRPGTSGTRHRQWSRRRACELARLFPEAQVVAVDGSPGDAVPGCGACGRTRPRSPDQHPPRRTARRPRRSRAGRHLWGPCRCTTSATRSGYGAASVTSSSRRAYWRRRVRPADARVARGSRRRSSGACRTARPCWSQLVRGRCVRDWLTSCRRPISHR
jgi:hypothetical protein